VKKANTFSICHLFYQTICAAGRQWLILLGAAFLCSVILMTFNMIDLKPIISLIPGLIIATFYMVFLALVGRQDFENKPIILSVVLKKSCMRFFPVLFATSVKLTAIVCAVGVLIMISPLVAGVVGVVLYVRYVLIEYSVLFAHKSFFRAKEVSVFRMYGYKTKFFFFFVILTVLVSAAAISIMGVVTILDFEPFFEGMTKTVWFPWVVLYAVELWVGFVNLMLVRFYFSAAQRIPDLKMH